MCMCLGQQGLVRSYVLVNCGFKPLALWSWTMVVWNGILRFVSFSWPHDGVKGSRRCISYKKKNPWTWDAVHNGINNATLGLKLRGEGSVTQAGCDVALRKLGGGAKDSVSILHLWMYPPTWASQSQRKNKKKKEIYCKVNAYVILTKTKSTRGRGKPNWNLCSLLRFFKHF